MASPVVSGGEREIAGGEAGGRQELRPEDVPHVRAVEGARLSSAMPATMSAGPACSTRYAPKPADGTGRQAQHQHADRDRRREKRDTGERLAVAQDTLDVKRADELEAVHRRDLQHLDGVQDEGEGPRQQVADEARSPAPRSDSSTRTAASRGTTPIGRLMCRGPSPTALNTTPARTRSRASGKSATRMPSTTAEVLARSSS
jgi:hypothetical protein